MKHIKRNFRSKAWVHPLGLGGGTEAKIQLFQNMVMFHIKLNGTAIAATW